MRKRSHMHGIVGLIIENNLYKYQVYQESTRPKRYTLCNVELADNFPSGRSRPIDQLQIYLQKLIDQKLLQMSSNTTPSVKVAAKEWFSYLKGVVAKNTLYQYSLSVEYYLKSTKPHTLANVSIKHLSDFRKFLKNGKNLKAYTIRKHQRHLATFFKYCLDQHGSPDLKIKKDPLPKKKIRGYSKEQLASIEKLMLSRYSGSIWLLHLRIHMLLSQTGIRGGELLNLKLEQIDLANKKIWIQDTETWSPKKGVEGWVPISDKLLEFITNDKRDSSERWYIDKGDGRHGYALVNGMTHALARYQKRLGITGIKPLHGYRAYVAKTLYAQHGIIEAQRILRHSDPMMTWKYIDDTDFNLHSVVQLL